MDILSPNAVSVHLKAKTKEESLKEMVDLLIESGQLPVSQREVSIKALMEREALGSTGVGQGVAIPHAKVDGLKKIVAALGISPKGILFDSIDQMPARVFFLLLAPKNSAEAHLKALARISRLVKENDHFRTQLEKSESSADVVRLIRQEDTF